MSPRKDRPFPSRNRSVCARGRSPTGTWKVAVEPSPNVPSTSNQLRIGQSGRSMSNAASATVSSSRSAAPYQRWRGRKSGSSETMSSGLNIRIPVLPLVVEGEPVEAVRRERDEVRQLTDRWERYAADHLDRHLAGVIGQHQLDWLRETTDVVHAQDDRLTAVLENEPPQVAEHGRVLGGEHLERADAEDRVLAADLDHPPQPMQERRRIACLPFDVDGLVAVDGIHERGQVQLREVGAAEPGIAIRRPL